VGRLAREPIRDRLATTGPAVVDGYGSFRARDALWAAFRAGTPPRVLRYRPADVHDAAHLLEWRNDPSVSAVSRNKEAIGAPEHARWLASVLADSARVLLVVEDGAGPAGSVRFDVEGEDAEISVVLAADRRGHGIGTQAIRESSELLLASRPEVGRVFAEVEAGNRASLVAFERADFVPAGEAQAGSALLELGRAGLARGLG
jgi:UDP-2,4-diacetamido-2,4,6-trideoxy-beta-L-altropyranose hydrolase